MRRFVLFASGILLGAFAALALAIFLATRKEKHVEAPMVAGNPVPGQNVSLDFTRRFNIHRRPEGTNSIFKDCLIVGFTGETNQEASMLSYGYRYFDKWVIIERPDGRRIYLRPDTIDFMEDAEAK